MNELNKNQLLYSVNIVSNAYSFIQIGFLNNLLRAHNLIKKKSTCFTQHHLLTKFSVLHSIASSVFADM